MAPLQSFTPVPVLKKTTASNSIEFIWRGLQPFREAYQIQLNTQKQVLEDGHARVLGFEHEAVITLGKRGNEREDIRQNVLSDIEIVRIDRGGHATLHSPGQLVIYPILPLRKWNLGVRDYVESLLVSTQDMLKAYGIDSFQKDQPGLYTRNGKIAFIGVRVVNGISLHGISINVKNDLKLFRHIKSCGIEAENFDSLAEQKLSLDTHELFHSWAMNFTSKNFRIFK
jgi:lipoyl(octanoyl) transferase